MVASHEASLADGASEFLLAGVRPLMPRELVATGEAAIAILLGARERPLSSMRARVRFQVRRLEVVLAAARMFALVHATTRLCAACTRYVDRRGGGRCCSVGYK